MQQELKTHFVNLLKSLGARGDILSVYANLVAKYSEPTRFYHNLEHIRESLEELDKARIYATFPSLVELAIWYHDAIYSFKSKDNEEKSAELCTKDGEALGINTGGNSMGYVVHLILSTKHSSYTEDKDSRIMLDIDLMRLGAPPERFAGFSQAIADEYAEATMSGYTHGRINFLKTMLERKKIYYTSLFYDRYEKQARENLANEIERLKNC